ncbi:MAG TPA: SUMF1/EgtB/PvdO family nonheme iron enzyme, partial [Myxococcota bacterium]|nr:SUMF1/EgtB/PvdO family nonheme iron enzyme [Myxococcota bacterium]
SYLRGRGTLDLLTEPADAEVEVCRLEARGRRLVPAASVWGGRGPIAGLDLPIGSYLLTLRATGRAPVKYPVFIGRDQCWSLTPPGEEAPFPVYLPMEHELSPDERYVPAGWTWLGGDPQAPRTLPLTKVWVPGFVIKAAPVSNQDYLGFLNDLVAQGRREEADLHAPCWGAVGSQEGQPLFPKRMDGSFDLGPDPQGAPVPPRHPVTWLRWSSAMAYAQWRQAGTGQPWRLPGDLEREKAARGVDRRTYPWGDTFDASWCNMSQSHAGNPRPVDVDQPEGDVSVYGVRGLAGNCVEWCADPFREDWPEPVAPHEPGLNADPSVARVLRGGGYT